MRMRTGVVLALAGSAYFGLTAARDLQPFDSSEFVLNAVEVGVGHPPGQPGYVLAAALWTRLLPVAPAAALSWFSAAATVLAALLALRLARRLCPGRSSWADAAALAAVWLVPGVWDLGTRPEVYAPAAALLLVPMSWALAPAQGHSWRGAAVAGLGLGLGASINPVMALGAGLVVGLVLIGIGRERMPARRALALAAALTAGGAVGLAPYLYLPLAGAHAGRHLVWGAPLWGADLRHFLLGHDYRSWQLSASEYARNLGAAASWLVNEALAPWAFLGVVGFAVAPLRRAARLAPLVLTVFGLLLIAANHPFIPSNPDYVGYLLPALWLDAAGVVLLLDRLTAASPAGARRRLLAWATAAALGAAGVLAGAPLASRRRGDDHLVRELASRVLEETPRGGVLLLESDYLVFPCLALQAMEGLRPDVVILNVGWSNSSWFWEQLLARHPSLPRPRDARAWLWEPPPALELRQARIVGFLAAAARPVAAESLRLASAGGPPCRGRWLGLTGRCGEGEIAIAVAGRLADSRRLVLAYALRGTLSERLLADVALARAVDEWRIGDPRAAWETLRAGLRPEWLVGLPPRLPEGPSLPWAGRSVLTQPRALASPEVVLLRLGDLLRASDPAGAAAYYARAAIPEAEVALATLEPIP